jgi:copper chaperone CopZ
MSTETVHVPGISCAHCKSTIEREMMELEGMQRVVVDLEPRRVTFTYDAPATPAKIKAEMDELGYPVAEGLGTNRSA